MDKFKKNIVSNISSRDVFGGLGMESLIIHEEYLKYKEELETCKNDDVYDN